jgi:acetyl-CoA synthetase
MHPLTTTGPTPPANSTSGELIAGEALERRLEELMHVDRFLPTAQFLARERVNETALHAQADLDPEAFWADQARKLHWDVPFTTVLDESRAPFYKWFEDGKLNVSYNCVDRHVEEGRGNRVAFHWAGEEGEHRAITYGELHRDVQKLANGLKTDGGLERQGADHGRRRPAQGQDRAGQAGGR